MGAELGNSLTEKIKSLSLLLINMLWHVSPGRETASDGCRGIKENSLQRNVIHVLDVFVFPALPLYANAHMKSWEKSQFCPTLDETKCLQGCQQVHL